MGKDNYHPKSKDNGIEQTKEIPINAKII